MPGNLATLSSSHRATTPVASPPAPTVDVEQVSTPPPGTMLVPIDAWDKMLLQLGNLHQAGQQLAEARERAARAETEAAFLRERLAEMRAAPSQEPATARSRMRSQSLQSPNRPRRPRCPGSAPICGGWRSPAATGNRHFSTSIFFVVLEIGPCRDIDAVVLRRSKSPPVGAASRRRFGRPPPRQLRLVSLIGWYRDVDVKPTTAGFGWLERLEPEMRIAPVSVDCVLSPRCSYPRAADQNGRTSALRPGPRLYPPSVPVTGQARARAPERIRARLASAMSISLKAPS